MERGRNTGSTAVSGGGNVSYVRAVSRCPRKMSLCPWEAELGGEIHLSDHIQLNVPWLDPEEPGAPLHFVCPQMCTPLSDCLTHFLTLIQVTCSVLYDKPAQKISNGLDPSTMQQRWGGTCIQHALFTFRGNHEYIHHISAHSGLDRFGAIQLKKRVAGVTQGGHR